MHLLLRSPTTSELIPFKARSGRFFCVHPRVVLRHTLSVLTYTIYALFKKQLHIITGNQDDRANKLTYNENQREVGGKEKKNPIYKQGRLVKSIVRVTLFEGERQRGPKSGKREREGDCGNENEGVSPHRQKLSKFWGKGGITWAERRGRTWENWKNYYPR